MDVLSEIHRWHREPDVISFGAAIRSEQWQQTLAMLPGLLPVHLYTSIPVYLYTCGCRLAYLYTRIRIYQLPS